MPRCARKDPIHLEQIREALIKSGYSKLDQQAKALGIHRATVWTIMKKKHKLGRLNGCTTKRILENPETRHPSDPSLKNIWPKDRTISGGQRTESDPASSYLHAYNILHIQREEFTTPPLCMSNAIAATSFVS